MGHGIVQRVRSEKRLKAKDIDKLPAGVHEDGGGLRLVVEPTGSRRWVLSVTIAGKRHNRGLGSYPLITLDAARDGAIDMRRAAREVRPCSRASPACGQSHHLPAGFRSVFRAEATGTVERQALEPVAV